VKQTEDVITKMTVKPTSPEKATTSQIKDCDSDLAHCSADTISEKKCSKNNVDNENLSQDAEFEPRLKILGRVETEFKFTSMNHLLVWNLSFVSNFCIIRLMPIYILLFRFVRLSIRAHDTEQIRSKTVGMYLQHDLSNWHSVLLVVKK
jgi:hypothetical protein